MESPDEDSLSDVAEYHGNSLSRSNLVRCLQAAVHKKLKKASSSSQRENLLGQLFADVALELDERARGLLLRPDKVSGQGAKVPSEKRSSLDPGASSSLGSSLESMQERWDGRPVCFYEVLAEAYAIGDDYGSSPSESLLPLFASLWSAPFTSQVFALLLHKWVFSPLLPLSDSDSQRYFRALVHGADASFWIDLRSDAQRFQPLYQSLLEQSTAPGGGGGGAGMCTIPPECHAELFTLLFRFYFLYQPARSLPPFLAYLSSLPNVALPHNPTDVFVAELTNQLQRVNVEPVLLRYLTAMRVLKGGRGGEGGGGGGGSEPQQPPLSSLLRSPTSLRLQVLLYSLASPGGPLFPSQPVRRAARGTLDALFPVGRRYRRIVSLTFRLLHPLLFWPQTILTLLASLMRKLNQLFASISEFFLNSKAKEGWSRMQTRN